jgi:hypothetical protein
VAAARVRVRKEVGEVPEDAAKLTVCSVRVEEGRKMEVDVRGGASSGQQWWTAVGEPIPAKEGVGPACGCLAKMEDEVGCLLEGGIKAGAMGMAGTAPAVLSAPPELEEEEERGLGIGIGRWGEDKVALAVSDAWRLPELCRRGRVCSTVLQQRGQRQLRGGPMAGREEREGK